METTPQLLYKGYNAESTTESDGTVLSYISTVIPDRYDEIVQPTGIQLTNYQKNPIVLLNHQSSGNSVAVGKNLWTKTDSKGLIGKTEFAPTTLGQELKMLYSGGFMKAFSLGFIPDQKMITKDAEGRIVYNQIELLEYSSVCIPANPDACTMALKSIKSPEIKDVFENFKKNYETEDRINELFESKKSFEDAIKNYSELELKVKELLESKENIFAKYDEAIKQQNEIIKTLNSDLQNILNKEQQQTKRKNIEQLIVQKINKKLGYE